MAQTGSTGSPFRILERPGRYSVIRKPRARSPNAEVMADANGDVADFAQVAARVAGRRMCRSPKEAEDLVQDTLLQGLRKWGSSRDVLIQRPGCTPLPLGSVSDAI